MSSSRRNAPQRLRRVPSGFEVFCSSSVLDTAILCPSDVSTGDAMSPLHIGFIDDQGIVHDFWLRGFCGERYLQFKLQGPANFAVRLSIGLGVDCCDSSSGSAICEVRLPLASFKGRKPNSRVTHIASYPAFTASASTLSGCCFKFRVEIAVEDNEPWLNTS